MATATMMHTTIGTTTAGTMIPIGTPGPIQQFKYKNNITLKKMLLQKANAFIHAQLSFSSF